ncbi:MAG: Fe-S cluster biogenesis protein NfuA, partial [Roseivirga sp.]
QELFAIPSVERVFYMSNFVTVTKSESVEWPEVQNQIKETIKGYLENDKPLILQEFDKDPLFDENDSEVVKKIKGILDEYIRPAVEQDGGAIAFSSFEEGVVKVNLQGSCSGCPASTVTLKSGIENLLKRMLPNDVTEVVAEGV